MTEKTDADRIPVERLVMRFCEECCQLENTGTVLQELYDTLCPTDDFGVRGSEFQTCSICDAGGSPYVEFNHDDDCPLKKVEAFLYGLREFESPHNDSNNRGRE